MPCFVLSSFQKMDKLPKYTLSLLILISFTVISGANQTASLNQCGHIILTSEQDQSSAPFPNVARDRKDVIEWVRDRGELRLKTETGWALFTFGEGLKKKTIRLYNEESDLLLQAEFDHIINLQVTADHQFAAFFDGSHLRVIDLHRGKINDYPPAIIFALDEKGNPAYYDGNRQCMVYGESIVFVESEVRQILFFQGHPLIFSREKAFCFRGENPAEIFRFRGQFFEAKCDKGTLYLVDRIKENHSFRYTLYFTSDLQHFSPLDQKIVHLKENMDIHEEIRSPVHYYESSFPSIVKNSYAQIQEWGDVYLHPGVDFFESPYTEVYSVHDGEVKAILTTGDERYWRIAIDNLEIGQEGYLYAHLNPDSFPFTVGDTVSAGDMIGTIFPAWGFSPHCHFARIAPAAHEWNGNWWTVNNPLVDVTNMTDSIPPVIENALGAQRFAFRTCDGVYLDPLNLSGEIQIIAKCVDYAVAVNFDSRINIWDIQFSIYDPLHPDTAIFSKYAFPQDMPLDTYFSNEYQTLVLNTIYSRDVACFSTNNSINKDFFYIITNSNGDSVITAEDSLQTLDTRNFYNGLYLLKVIVKDASMNQATAYMPIGIYNDFPPYRQFDLSPIEHPPLTIQCSPNPFNPSTTFQFTLNAGSRVTLDIFDISGRTVARLVDGRINPGCHQITFNAADLPSGILFYRLLAGENCTTGKILLLK